MKDIATETLLYDFYGKLLSEKKRRTMELYHEEDMSITEIAEALNISRAAVHDSLKSAEKTLDKYEQTLHLLEKFRKEQVAKNEILKKIKTLKAAICEEMDDHHVFSLINEIEHIAKSAIVD